jgi:hypothetical protein
VRGEKWWHGPGFAPLTSHLLPLTVLLASCSGVTPLTNRIKIGEEPFVIAVGEGPDGQTDLFAAPAGGGAFTRLTFNRPEERFPKISPTGELVAFLRASDGTSGPPWSLVILNLRTNAERAMPLPQDAGEPERLGWSRDGGRVVLSAQGYFAMAAPQAPPQFSRFSSDSIPLADSLSREVLGDPPQGIVRECVNGGLCILAVTGEVTTLDTAARDAVRWGADSVGYALSGRYEVRPLRGGHSRQPAWTGAPAGLRQLTYNGGPQVTTSSGVSGIR